MYYIPATKLASENNTPTLANMIMMGKYLKEGGLFDENSVTEALKKVVSVKHADMLNVNLGAVKLGSIN